MPQIEKFTEKAIAKLEPPDQGRVEYFERLKNKMSLVLCISYGGTWTWRALYYVDHKGKDGKHIRAGRTKRLGTYPDMPAEKARAAAFEFKPDNVVTSEAAVTFKAVGESWIKEHVEASGLRSQDEIKRHLSTYVYPKWEERPFLDIRFNADVKPLLHGIRDDHGLRQAGAVLATIRSLMNWYEAEASEDDDNRYRSPIPRRYKIDKRTVKQRSRSRILDEDEIRWVWKAAGEMDTYGALVKMLFLTMQRRGKVTTMKWADIKNGIWTIHEEDTREKGTAGKIKLPQMALDIIEAQPRIKGNPFVFAASIGNGPFNSFSQRKEETDELLPKGMKPWTLHDIRRTARSLMPRAKVLREHSERTMGHVIPGVEGVYDHHKYFDEKSQALNELAQLISRILEG
jgi:integrase